MKKNHGFTLVELIVSIAIGSIVTFAATTVLLLGLRVNQQGAEIVQNQYTARIILNMLEDLASEGSIKGVAPGASGWFIFSDEKGEVPLLSYDAAEQKIMSGSTEILDNVYASHLSVDDTGKVLTFAIETPEGSYTTSVYCRTMEYKKNPAAGDNYKDEADQIIGSELDKDTSAARKAFLDILAKQYKLKGGTPNRGLILNGGINTGVYYSEWYIGEENWGTNGWNKNTPWCACFVSWGLNEVSHLVEFPEDRIVYDDDGKPLYCQWYANVDEFMEYFQKKTDGADWTLAGAKPTPGDIVFFDWNGDKNTEHVGVVLRVDSSNIYTIEGNSAGIVAVRKYPLSDSRILGYGVLPWGGSTGSGS